jgi:hypothetical protein
VQGEVAGDMDANFWLISGFMGAAALLVTLAAFGLRWRIFQRMVFVIGLISFYLFLMNLLLMKGEWLGIVLSFPLFLLIAIYRRRLVKFSRSVDTRKSLLLSLLFSLVVVGLDVLGWIPSPVKLMTGTIGVAAVLVVLLWLIGRRVHRLNRSLTR